MLNKSVGSLKKLFLRGLIVFAAIFLFSAGIIVYDGLTDEIGAADVAIVLGNKVNADGKPSRRLRARLDKAVELYRQKFFSEIIVSGGLGKEGFDEASVMEQYLVAKGINPEHIFTDHQGVNTYATAKNAANLMKARGMKSALVITQYYHIARAKAALVRFGIQPVFSAHAQVFEFRDFYSVAREVFGYYAYAFSKKS